MTSGRKLRDEGAALALAMVLTLIALIVGSSLMLLSETETYASMNYQSMTQARFAAEYAMWEEDPFTFAPVGGESGVAVLARALPAVRQMIAAHQGERILAVSHKATIRLLLSSLLGFDPRGYRDRLDPAPACLNVIDFIDPVRARLMLFNDTSHYHAAPSPAGQNLSKWWG